MKLATTTGDFQAYTHNQNDAILEINKAGFKYIDYSSEYAPSYIQYQIHIGGATSTALERNLKKLEIDDFEEIYKCQSEEELYKCITDLNRNE